MIETDLYTYLTGKSGITDEVSTRIYPSRVPQGESMPAIVYSIVTSDSGRDQTGVNGLVRTIMQLDCYGDTYADARNAHEAVRTNFDGYRGTMGSTVVRRVTRLNDISRFTKPEHAGDKGRYRLSSDYAIWHVESVPSL